jgi:hypothetical protein
MHRLHHVITGFGYGQNNVWHKGLEFINSVGDWFIPNPPDGNSWGDVVPHEGRNKLAVQWPEMKEYADPIIAIQGIECEPWDIECCWTYQFEGCTMYETTYRFNSDRSHLGVCHFTFDFHDETLGLLFKLEML